MTNQKRADYWDRYWTALKRWAPDAKAAQARFADRLLRQARGRQWLDAGAGRTSFYPWRTSDAEELRASGARMFGCDLDFAALRDRTDGALVCLADLAQLPYRDGSFDLVVSNMVFEHLEDPERAICELTRVTRPEGRILVHTVNARHPTSLLARVTPHSFHEWIVERVEGRSPADTYPTRYEANSEGRLCELFGRVGWAKCWGGLTSTIPYFIPYPGLFWLGFYVGLIEIALSERRILKPFLKPNLLLEFKQVSTEGR